ncbi:MAG: hypothetical protein ACYC5H_13575 [Methylovirgula sp.]
MLKWALAFVTRRLIVSALLIFATSIYLRMTGETDDHAVNFMGQLDQALTGLNEISHALARSP